MIGIRAIGSYVPEGRLDTVAAGGEFGQDPRFVTEKIGFTSLSRKSAAEET